MPRADLAIVSFGTPSTSVWTVGAIGWGAVETVPVLLGELGGGEGGAGAGTWLPGDAVHVQYLGADLAPLSFTAIYDGVDVTADTTIWTGHPDGIPRLLYALPVPTAGGDRIFTVTVTDHAGHTQSGDYTVHVLWTAPPYMIANVSGQDLGTPSVMAWPYGQYAGRVAVSAIYGNDTATGVSVPTQIRIRVNLRYVTTGVEFFLDENIDLTPDGADDRLHGSVTLNWGSTPITVVGAVFGDGSTALDYNYCYFNPPGAFFVANVAAYEQQPPADTEAGTPVVYPSYPPGEFA